jgi:hypothetical protein
MLSLDWSMKTGLEKEDRNVEEPRWVRFVDKRFRHLLNRPSSLGAQSP